MLDILYGKLYIMYSFIYINKSSLELKMYSMMNRAQKIAWFNLIVNLIALVLSSIAVAVLTFVVALPLRAALGGLGFTGIIGFTGLSPFLFRKAKGQVEFDERDHLYNSRAWFLGFCASYLLFVIVCMTTWFIRGPKGTISANVLPLTVMGGFLALMLVHSLAILGQYGWTDKGEN